MDRFAAALQFLTLIPTPRTHLLSLGRAVIFFPVVGGLLGAFAGGLLLLLQPNWGNAIASLVAISSLVLLTGALHEDGLADAADGCRAGRSPEIILRIMKDSRIGVYGSIALLCTLLLRWQALSRCRMNPVLGLVAALALSRTGLVALAGFTKTLGDGLGATFGQDLAKPESRPAIYVTIFVGLTIALLSARMSGLWMACCSAIIIVGARSYFMRRIGGVNGDCLGATCQIIETVNLLILAWQPST